MADLLVSKPGQVAVIAAGDALPGSITVTRVGNGPLGQNSGSQVQVFQSSRVIITGVNYGQAGNVQFQQSLQDTIYMYVFGERMGQLEISGLAFASSCTAAGDPQAGVDDVLKYYQDFRVTKAGDSVSVVIGRTPVVGFVVNCSIKSVSPNNMLYGFSFGLASMPPSLDSNPNRP